MLSEKSQWLDKAALVFGREDSGLTNEELELADVLTGAPMVADYPSLNLGRGHGLLLSISLPNTNPPASGRRGK